MEKNLQQGVTLIELVITVVVLAIIIAIAVPSYQRMVAKTNIRTITNDFVAAVQEARIEALARKTNIELRAGEDFNSNCDEPSEWQKGWYFGEPRSDSNFLIERTWVQSECFVDIKVTGVSDKKIVFLRSGFLIDDEKTFCFSSKRAKGFVRKVTVQKNGKVKVENKESCS